MEGGKDDGTLSPFTQTTVFSQWKKTQFIIIIMHYTCCWAHTKEEERKQGYTLRSCIKFCKLYTVINTQELYKICITNTSHLHARSTCSYREITWFQWSALLSTGPWTTRYLEPWRDAALGSASQALHRSDRIEIDYNVWIWIGGGMITWG